MNFLFGFTGRIGRGAWWLGQLIAVILGVCIGAILIVNVPKDLPRSAFETGEVFRAFPVSAALAMACLGALALWINIAVTIKRYHDRGKPGIWFLMMFVPYIGSIWIFVECGCLRGKTGPNTYDPPDDDGYSLDRGRMPARRLRASRMMATSASNHRQVEQPSRRPTGPTGFGKRRPG